MESFPDMKWSSAEWYSALRRSNLSQILPEITSKHLFKIVINFAPKVDIKKQ